MLVDLEKSVQEHRDVIYLLLREYRQLQTRFLLHTDLVERLEQFCSEEPGSVLRDTSLYRLIYAAQEAFFRDSAMYLDVRWKVAQRDFWQIHCEDMMIRKISVAEFLRAKERIVDPMLNGVPRLDVDLKPFERGFPRLKDTRSIGHGVEYLNRHLSNRLFQDLDNGGQKLFDFLRLHRVQGSPLMLNSSIANLESLRGALQQADEFLARREPESEWREIAAEMAHLGFEPGWGKTAARAGKRWGSYRTSWKLPVRSV